MKFSVLVPVYNVEKYLDECVQSVLAQTFTDFELILVDDGSTDRSGELCDGYARTNSGKVRVIHKENRGLISARRIGIANAAGEFCVFVDSDDFIEPELLESVAQTLEKDSTVDIVIYSFRYFRDGQKAERFPAIAADSTSWNEDNKKYIYKKLLTSNEFSSLATKAVRTELLKADPTDYTAYYSKNMAEDLLQSLYIYTAAGKAVFVDKVLYDYRINSASVSRSYRPETINSKNTLHVYEKMREYLPQWGMDTPEARNALDVRWFHEMMYNFMAYYENAADGEMRDGVLRFNWNTMLPPGLDVEKLSGANPAYVELYGYWVKREYRKIKLFFAKKELHKTVKKLKAKL